MDSFPVKLVLPDRPDFMVTPGSQCVFEVIIPLGIPRLIDTTLPAAPYIGREAFHDSLQILVRPTMRAILSGLLRELMGSGYPICSLLGSDPDGDIGEAYRLHEGFYSKHLTRAEAGVALDFETWKEKFGKAGDMPIEGYTKGFDGSVHLMYAFKYVLVQGPSIPTGDENPRAIQFRAEPTLCDGKVVFHAREYNEKGRKGVNDSVKHDFEFTKAREDAGIPIVFSSL